MCELYIRRIWTRMMVKKGEKNLQGVDFMIAKKRLKIKRKKKRKRVI